jgi:hypothetical protein
MSDRPSQLWKEMPVEKRQLAAEAFWRDNESPEIQAQHVEALVAIARRLNFRAKSVQALPVERRAKHLAQMRDVSDALATRALIAYHFATQRPLMTTFLDALGIAHNEGLITAEDVAPPNREQLSAAMTALLAAHPDDDARRYLKTLVALDEDTWVNLPAVLGATD